MPIDPAIIAAVGAIGSSVASSISAKRRNDRESKQREKEANKSMEQLRAARQLEDSDKMDSLRRAGLNANMAYSGGTPITPTINPATVENEGEGVANSLKEGSKNVADLMQNQPAVDASVENTQENTNVQRATAEKTKEEAESLRLQNDAVRGENEGSRFKLQQFGLDPDAIPVSHATGYFKAIDFGDEFKTKGAERGARSSLAKIETAFNEKINSDETFKKRYQDGRMAQLDSFVLGNESTKLSQQLQKQEISTFGLRKQALQLGNLKTDADTKKVYVDIDAVKATTQIAKENSYTELMRNMATALREGNAEQYAYNETLFQIKSGTYSSFTNTLSGRFNDALGQTSMYNFLHKLNETLKQDRESNKPKVMHYREYEWQNYVDDIREKRRKAFGPKK